MIWHYHKQILILLKQTIELFDWQKSLSNLDVNNQIFQQNDYKHLWKSYCAQNYYL